MRLIIASLIALFLSASAFAHVGSGELDNPNVALEELGNKKIQLKLLEIPEGKILVTFKNKNSNVIFKDVIENGQFTKKNYDLNALANGNYSVEIFSRNHGTLENFMISLGAEKTASDYFTKTKVIDKDRIALLVKTTDDVNGTVKVYHKGHIIFEEDFSGDAFAKVFKFEKVYSLKDITFEVTDENGFGKYISSK